MKLKLKVINYFWAVGRRTRRVGSRKMPLIEGQTMDLDFVQFKIDKIEADKVIVTVNRQDGTLIKSITVVKGESSYYRPMSMDAGHAYVLKLTKLF